MSTKKTEPKERTIEWWLAKLPPDIAKLALANRKTCKSFHATYKTAETLSAAVELAFYWYRTTQGEAYWSNVSVGEYDEARALLPKPAKKAKAYRAYVSPEASKRAKDVWTWLITMGGPTCHSRPYTTKKNAIRGLRRFAATLGIAVEIEGQE
jgi:hypothetical protein